MQTAYQTMYAIFKASITVNVFHSQPLDALLTMGNVVGIINAVDPVNACIKIHTTVSVCRFHVLTLVDSLSWQQLLLRQLHQVFYQLPYLLQLEVMYRL